MKPRIRIVLCALALVTAASCAHAPQLYNDSTAMEQERLAYIQNHPEGKYNAHIMRGEIVKGMNEDDVTASWGLPGAKRHVEESQYEQWDYASKDSVSGTWTIFSLAFKRNVLIDWMITENVITGEGIEPELDKVPAFSPSDFDRTNVDMAPIRKGKQYTH